MQKIKNIEALRFLFILSIIACHLNQGITNVIDNPIYKSNYTCSLRKSGRWNEKFY